MTSNIDFWKEGLCTFHPMCVVLLLFNKILRGNCEIHIEAFSSSNAMLQSNCSKLIKWFTWYCTYFLKIGFVVARGRFYSYYNLQCIKLDKENVIQEEEKTVLCIQKTFNAVFKTGFNPVLGSIPRLPCKTHTNCIKKDRFQYKRLKILSKQGQKVVHKNVS